jgi:GNAT superfamily N-acetyltransferase
MNDAALYGRLRTSLHGFCTMLGDGSEESRTIALDGVIAAVVPATPERSVCNSVTYEEPEALARALEPLAEAYDRAGVKAWTVWVPEDDGRAQQVLEQAGHHLDATPAAMALELERLECEAPGGVELDPEPDISDVGRINDLSYGHGSEFEHALTRRPPNLHVWVARVDGRPAACAGAVHTGGDCGIYLVATVPEARGRGLARDLVTLALLHGREAGCTTASLQATAMGKPVYARLGFRDLGPIGMWERRAG